MTKTVCFGIARLKN